MKIGLRVYGYSRCTKSRGIDGNGSRYKSSGGTEGVGSPPRGNHDFVLPEVAIGKTGFRGKGWSAPFSLQQSVPGPTPDTEGTHGQGREKIYNVGSRGKKRKFESWRAID